MVRTILMSTALALGACLLTWGLTPAVRAADTVPAKPGPIILLKLDDVVQFPTAAINPNWQRVTDYVEKNQLKASFGIICSSLEDDNPAYFNWIKDHQKKGFIEFWCHGYQRRTAQDKGEFEQGTFEEQKAIFEKCQKLAQDKLGFTLPAFGEHWSGTTEETEKAVQATPEIKIWLYGPKKPQFFKRLSLPRIMGLENPTFVPDFDKFKATYEKVDFKQEVMVLQGHAAAWDDARWAGFVKIIEFLQSKNCVFMTPSEYLKSIADKKTM